MNTNDFKLGQDGPMGKKIKGIVFRSDQFIVYLDSDDTIQSYRMSCDFPEHAGEILNKVSLWESKINGIFSKKKAYQLKLLLAEGIARIFHDGNIVQARDVINLVTKNVERQGRESLKQAYAIASVFTTLMICLAIFIARICKEGIILNYSYEEYKIGITALFGGIGAFVFTIVRLKRYQADIEIDKFYHVVDGVLRIFYGVIFGLVTAMAIKANLLLGFLNQIDKNIYVFVFLGICAGASEVLVPSLIKQMETKNEKVRLMNKEKSMFEARIENGASL